MKKSKRIQAIIATLLLLSGIALLGWMLHISGGATTAAQTWLYGALGVVPILIGSAWTGAIYRREIWHASNRSVLYRWALVAFGAVLIMFGIGIVLYNSGWISAGWKHVFISWQMILLLIGIHELNRGRGISAALALLLGGFFIAPRVATMFPTIYEPLRAVGFLPILLIAVGIVIVVGAICRSFHCERGGHPNGNDKCGRADFRHRGGFHNRREMYSIPSEEEVITGDGRIEENLYFSGMSKIILDPVFNGGHIEVRFGGAVLDLRKTSLPEGVTTLYLTGFMGGINIIASSDWRIEIQNSNSFGAFIDKRSGIIYDKDAVSKLVIVANFRFGGGEIASSN